MEPIDPKNLRMRLYPLLQLILSANGAIAEAVKKARCEKLEYGIVGDHTSPSCSSGNAPPSRASSSSILSFS
jgi:hypothetical protein